MLFNLGWDSVEVATHAQQAVATTVATTTSPHRDSWLLMSPHMSINNWRRGWDSNPCGTDDPRALKARALTTLPPRHYESTVLVHCVLNVYRVLRRILAKVLNSHL